MANREQEKSDVLQGTLDVMVLQTLETLGPLHGYAIAARLEQVSSGAVRLNMGTLYPALMRLEQRGFVRGEELDFGGFPGSLQIPFHGATSWKRNVLESTNFSPQV